VNFYSEQITFNLKSKLKIRAWLLKCIADEKKLAGELTFIFCSDKYLKKINKKFLDHNYNTDIITFPYSAPAEKKLSGDIYISIDSVKYNAKKYSVAFADELQRVMVHGILHLCGYADKTEKEQKKMRSLEDKYLALFSKM
jgi:probable rRNA maturation factor